MTERPLEPWKPWRDTLVGELRKREVPNVDIGDILLEVASHVADTGDSPHDAFGDPTAYAIIRADSLAPTPPGEKPDKPFDPIQAVKLFVIPYAGAYALAWAALSLGRGQTGWLSWAGLVVGLVMVLSTFITVPIDVVRDPRTDDPMLDDPRRTRVLMSSFFIVAACICFFIGRLQR